MARNMWLIVLTMNHYWRLLTKEDQDDYSGSEEKKDERIQETEEESSNTSQTPQAQNRQTRLLESDFPADTPAKERKVQRPEGTERLQDGSSSKTEARTTPPLGSPTGSTSLELALGQPCGRRSCPRAHAASLLELPLHGEEAMDGPPLPSPPYLLTCAGKTPLSPAGCRLNPRTLTRSKKEFGKKKDRQLTTDSLVLLYQNSKVEDKEAGLLATILLAGPASNVKIQDRSIPDGWQMSQEERWEPDSDIRKQKRQTLYLCSESFQQQRHRKPIRVPWVQTHPQATQHALLLRPIYSTRSTEDKLIVRAQHSLERMRSASIKAGKEVLQ